MKRLLVLLLTLCMALSTMFGLVACTDPAGPGNNGGGGDGSINNVQTGNKLEMKVVNMGGGIGRKWLDQAAERYATLNKDTQYSNGKVGVYINITSKMGVSADVANAPTAPYDVFFCERDEITMVQGEAGILLNLDSIVKDETRAGGSLESIIFDSAKASLIGYDEEGNGSYYALPHYEFFGGLQYNREVFQEYGALFVDKTQSDLGEATAHILSTLDDGDEYYLVGPGIIDNDYKSATYGQIDDSIPLVLSVGPDGIPDTDDDGMPCSFEEFVILCDYLSTACGETKALSLSGKCHNYFCYYLAGMWASLAGQMQMQNYYTYEGKAEIVTGYYDEPIMEGIDYIRKPKTEWVDIELTEGYKFQSMAAKYYAAALGEIFTRNGYYGEWELGKNVSHLDAQKSLIYGGKAPGVSQTKVGMLIEATYWYNESTDGNCFKDYRTLTGDAHEVDIRTMPLPTAYTTAEHEARKLTAAEAGVTDTEDAEQMNAVHRASALIDIGYGKSVINKKVEGNPALKGACLDFLAFCYSDEELQLFTVNSGQQRALSYELSTENYNKLSGYYQRLWDLRDNEQGSNIIYPAAKVNASAQARAVYRRAIVETAIELQPNAVMGCQSPSAISFYSIYANYEDRGQEMVDADNDGEKFSIYKYGTEFCFKANEMSFETWRALSGMGEGM